MDFERVGCEGVTRSFGRKSALSGVDLCFRAGEITAVVGANGAGKSTLLSILSTLLPPSSGEVRYGERSHPQASRLLRGSIGLVSHSALLYPDLSALENLELGARLHGMRDGSERAKKLLSKVGLPRSVWRRPARSYSRGMVQRLALSKALLHDPRLLLLDEPFTGLDPEATEMLRELLLEARRRGAIMVLVTHDLEIGAGLASRTAILRRGRVAHLCEREVGTDALVELYKAHGAPAAGRT